MISKKVTRHYADGCNKGFWKKQSALHHEENCKCWKNPKNKSCITCKHGEYAHYEPDTGGGGEWECGSELNEAEAHTGGPSGVDYISVKCIYHEV